MRQENALSCNYYLGGFGIDAVQKRGGKPYQQDSFGLYRTGGLDKAALTDIFEKMQSAIIAELGINAQTSGTTATLAAINAPDDILIGYAGDTHAALFSRRHDGLYCMPLATRPHHYAAHAGETRRIAPHIATREAVIHTAPAYAQTAGGYRIRYPEIQRISTPYTGRKLQITRALGDTACQPALSHAPDFLHWQPSASGNIGEIASHTLCLYTDGLSDVLMPGKDEAGKTFYTYSHLPAHFFTREMTARAENRKNLAKVFADYASTERTLADEQIFAQDNQTILALDLSDHSRDTQPLLLAVFDGHGQDGAQVSRIAAHTIASHPAIIHALG